MEDSTHVASDPPDAEQGKQRHSRMALAALMLSLGAFLPPLGIAAVVLGHLSSRRIATSGGRVTGKTTARGALIIAYLNMLLVAATFVVCWRVLHMTTKEFQRDPLVQRMFREEDSRQTLDEVSAHEEERTAQRILYQLVAIQDQYHRSHGQGYLCSIPQLVEIGLESATVAERRALQQRIEESPYLYELRSCATEAGDRTGPHYILSAVPRTPRMPANSTIFCTGEIGEVHQVREGTSLDCLARGYPVH